MSNTKVKSKKSRGLTLKALDVNFSGEGGTIEKFFDGKCQLLISENILEIFTSSQLTDAESNGAGTSLNWFIAEALNNLSEALRDGENETFFTYWPLSDTCPDEMNNKSKVSLALPNNFKIQLFPGLDMQRALVTLTEH